MIGSTVTRPKLAATLLRVRTRPPFDLVIQELTPMQVANEGSAAFYTGEIAQGMVNATQAAGGACAV